MKVFSKQILYQRLELLQFVMPKVVWSRRKSKFDDMLLENCNDKSFLSIEVNWFYFRPEYAKNAPMNDDEDDDDDDDQDEIEQVRPSAGK